MKLDTSPQDLIFIETAGFSMWPFIKQGEKLIVKKASIEDLRIGDVILYLADNQIVCHRLVKKIKHEKDCLLYARGDNSLSPGELVIEKSLIGKVAGVLKKGRVVNLTGRQYNFINRLIVWIGPLFGMGSRVIKRKNG
ncbi:signal peptidase I [Candidatus Omnitrophota bacterium]